MKTEIAIIGMACRYPDAQSPLELWETVLARRRVFRCIPAERLAQDDYVSSDRENPDTTYATQAAVLEGYEFDRARFRVAGSTFRQVDMTHWLALEVAADALADAGFPLAEGLPKDSTGVLVGNSLTGEFSRANLMRLRWPYVRGVIDTTLAQRQWSPEDRAELLEELEQTYKSPFPAVGDETLAGGLSNTIAGRICNFFDLHGGGYTVDGACASSLLSVANVCTALSSGDVDVALAGGVDLSLDPFELVGFAKVGALAESEMRVFDERSTGFWPGEGCGFLVLMRAADAEKQHRRIYATIQGWGISSDGSGGITRPEVAGQKLALQRAYGRAGFGIETVGYFEGHGTGTALGDTTELTALSELRRSAMAHGPPAVIGSVKANIGHTKAAAGAAGMIKATMALYEQLVPPTTGVNRPHPVLSANDRVLQIATEAQPWPASRPLRAGVSAMGFGGINAHIVLQGATARRRTTFDLRQRSLAASAQDAELFLLAAPDRSSLAAQVDRLAGFAARLSRAELSDLSAELARTTGRGPIRAAMVAADAQQLDRGLNALASHLKKGNEHILDLSLGMMLAGGVAAPSIGFLFPGQGSPSYLQGGIWRRRFEDVEQLYLHATLPARGDRGATEVAQPAIITASLAGLRVLDRLAIHATAAVGHSLGELAAYHWAGVLDEAALLRVAAARGQAMAQCGGFGGAMASVAAAHDVVEPMLDGQPVVIAGINSPTQTVVSGEAAAIDELVTRANALGLRAVNLPVSHAFHSPMVAEAEAPLRRALEQETFQRAARPVASTVTGDFLRDQEDLRGLLLRQVTSPVRFLQAFRVVADSIDLWIEVGPGAVMQGLAKQSAGETPVVSLDAGSNSLQGLLQAVGCAFVLGAPVNYQALFAGRFTRPFDLDWQPSFLANPCEQVTKGGPAPQAAHKPQPSASTVRSRVDETEPSEKSPLELVRQIVAERIELAITSVRDHDRLLGDLHLSSIAVGQIVSEASQALGLAPPVSPTDYAHATVAEVATALEELRRTRADASQPATDTVPLGVDAWTRMFAVELTARSLANVRAGGVPGDWQVVGEPDDPLCQSLHVAFESSVPGDGLVVCLPPQPSEQHVAWLLEGAQAALAASGAKRFVLVEQGRGGAAVARTLHLENRSITTCVVNVPAGHCPAAEWVAAEAQLATGYCEAHYDKAGTRRAPVLRLLPQTCETGDMPLGRDDVLLVTGGGKGIAAECALMLAQETGVRLALLGRSDAQRDPELSRNLQRMDQLGARYRYFQADVTDARAVQVATAQAQQSLGPITAILHGAGTNVPKLLSALQPADFADTLRPKVKGLENVLAAIDPQPLRLLVTFGSIIARTGMQGEAHYALANDWLTQLTEQWQVDHPRCRCLAVEWSVWSGVGMGERLGRIDALKQQGITALGPDVGVGTLKQLLKRSSSPVAVVVTGRFGQPPTLKMDVPDLPLWRFLENPRVFVPGVELVVEAQLSHDSDPYLNDHEYQGVPLLPAVMGLEAMAQVATALSGASEALAIELDHVEFDRPVVVGHGSATTIRLAGLCREAGRVEVVLRSAETGFQVDHFRANCRVCMPSSQLAEPRPRLTEGMRAEPPQHGSGNGNGTLSLDPACDLYGGILFHRGRFQRLQRYRHLRATECIAEITPHRESDWFRAYHPMELLLGDPGARDATIHAIQACIPHGTILPTGVERILILGHSQAENRQVHARERSHDGDTFVYDIDVCDQSGRVFEQWQGLRLRRVGQIEPSADWAEPLLGPYLERRLRELVPGTDTSIVVQRNGAAAARGRDEPILGALGQFAHIHRRPDGKPIATCDRAVSVAHADKLTLAVAGQGIVACDIEPIMPNTAKRWRDLLGQERIALVQRIAQQSGEELATAATRVWAAAECLKKAGAAFDLPLVVRSTSPDDWVVLGAGETTVATWVTAIGSVATKLAVAILVSKDL